MNRVSFEPNLDGFENMRRDQALLADAEAGQPGARVYSWNAVWVTLGHNQIIEETLVDPNATRWVRRPSGGSAVLHGHDVTVALAFPAPKTGAYRLAAMPLVQALRALAIDAALAEDVHSAASTRRLPDCFASTSKNDIVNRQTIHKICGCALRRTRTAVLLQASIPARTPTIPCSQIILGGVDTEVVPISGADFALKLQTALLHAGIL